MNLSSGVAPVRTFLEEGMHVGIGSDVAGGSTENLFKAMALAIQASSCAGGCRMTVKPLTLEGSILHCHERTAGVIHLGNVGSVETGIWNWIDQVCPG